MMMVMMNDRNNNNNNNNNNDDNNNNNNNNRCRHGVFVVVIRWTMLVFVTLYLTTQNLRQAMSTMTAAHLDGHEDVWNHHFGYGPPDMQIHMHMQMLLWSNTSSSSSKKMVIRTPASRISSKTTSIGSNTLHNKNDNTSTIVVLQNETRNATVMSFTSAASQVPLTTNATSTTDTIIILHGVQGRMGNYLMQYSAAMGMADLIPGKVHLCLTPQTIRKRQAIHDQFQGPFAPMCTKRILTQYSAKPKDSNNDSSSTGTGTGGDWREFNDTYESKFLREAHDCIANHNQHTTQQQQQQQQQQQLLNTNFINTSSTTTTKSATVTSNSPCIFRMVGFWSSHLYHNHVREELRQIWNLTNFTPIQQYFAAHEERKRKTTSRSGSLIIPTPNSTTMTNYTTKITTTTTTTTPRTTFVGIHVRRTDMIKVQAYQLPDMNYYKRAMQYFRDKHNAQQQKKQIQSHDNNNKNNNNNTSRTDHDDNSNNNIIFLIASDDKAWCRNQFRSIPDAYVVEDDILHGSTSSSPSSSNIMAASVELVLLAHCDFVIQSVGTFGWWAAYLSPHYQESVYPHQSYAYNPEYWTQTRRNNHLVSTWVGL